jgi:hypothetical protein
MLDPSRRSRESVISIAFFAFGKTHGLTRKGRSLYVRGPEVDAVLNLQGSVYGGGYYLNVGFWFHGLGDDEYPASHRCHIVLRADDLVDDPVEMSRLLSKEYSIPDDRTSRLTAILDGVLAQTRALGEVAAFLTPSAQQLLKRCGVTGPAQRLLAGEPIAPSSDDPRTG